MKRALLVLAAALAVSNSVAAQSSSDKPPAQPQQQVAPKPVPDLSAQVPAAKPDDVKSIDNILAALYNVISGPAGDRDWNRFRSLFLPEARLTSAGKDAEGNVRPRLHSVEDYVGLAGGYFAQHAFYESPIVNHVQKFGDVVQVFSSYESRNAPGEAPFARGINSIQLLYDGKRWWVVSILWDEERPDNPLPKDFATKAENTNK